MREREYPRTPYPGDVPRTRLYRDGWDRAWELARAGGLRWAIDLYKRRAEGAATRDDPYRFGMAAGLHARWEWEARQAEADRVWRERRRAADEAFRAERGRWPWEVEESPDLPY